MPAKRRQPSVRSDHRQLHFLASLLLKEIFHRCHQFPPESLSLSRRIDRKQTHVALLNCPFSVHAASQASRVFSSQKLPFCRYASTPSRSIRSPAKIGRSTANAVLINRTRAAASSWCATRMATKLFTFILLHLTRSALARCYGSTLPLFSATHSRILASAQNRSSPAKLDMNAQCPPRSAATNCTQGFSSTRAARNDP
jgi:hypothetical protein